MCGIAGFVGTGDREDLRRMVAAVTHRGPDDEGIEVFPDDAVYLGHRRLSIVDIADGRQPMCNEDGSVWVTFNGEIYNHLSLRRELQAKGHDFKTDHSDTEILVHGWQEWGEELPAKLNGMFAFAVWDGRKKTLFLARDRFGEKPLYWGRQGELFLFASELSAFNGHRAFSAEINRDSLKKYFAHGFIPSPNAIYRDTEKLKPGHWLRRSSDGTTECRSYWQFRIEQAANPPSLDEAAEEVRALLLRSVERRLMSDVPLGVFLSGGIDSSAVAGAMCSLGSPKHVQSFCIGFQEPSFDESQHGRTVAEFLGCEHFEDILSLDAAKYLIDEVLRRMDEPLADGSVLPTYLVSRFARSRVTVALTGDGGDELFAGYDPFEALRPAAIYHSLVPRFLHKGARRLAELLPKSAANMSFDFKLRRALQGLDYGPSLWNPVWLAPLEKSDIEDLFAESVHVEDLYREVLELWRRDDGLSTLDKTLEFYSCFYLPDNILTKVDRAAMMNGLEARAVFLDPDLADFVRTLPASYKSDGRARKIVLKKALSQLVPEKVLNRPKKGFGLPLMAWMRELDINVDRAAPLGLDPDCINRSILSHKRNTEDKRLFLWAWLSLQRFSRGRSAPTSC